ncbi:MAG: hypothetical protein ACPGVB_10105 [Chitinophagales bacterium]
MTFKRMSDVAISQVSFGYKLNDRVSIGLGTNSLGNCKSGYYNTEGQFVSLNEDDDDEHEDMDDDDEDEDEMEDDDDDDECEVEDFGNNILGNITYHLTNNLFVQAAGGYAFNSKAPVYTAMVGYKYNLACGLGISKYILYE